MLVKISSLNETKKIRALSLKIKQKEDEITILPHHEMMIYAVSDGLITIDSNEKFNIEHGVVVVQGSLCKIILY